MYMSAKRFNDPNILFTAERLHDRRFLTMKITKTQLKQIINEEFERVLEEDDTVDLFRSMGVKQPFIDREQKEDMKNVLEYLKTVERTLTVDELIRKIEEEPS